MAARSPVFGLPRNDEKHSEFSKVTSGPYPGVIVIALSALSSVRVEDSKELLLLIPSQMIFI